MSNAKLETNTTKGENYASLLSTAGRSLYLNTESTNTQSDALEATMLMQLTIESELVHFELPPAVQLRLQALLDRQESGQELTENERKEAEGLVELAEFLSLLRLRSERLSAEAKVPENRQRSASP